MTSHVKSAPRHSSRLPISGPFSLVFGRRRSQQITTVDPADIRGLGTTLHWSVGCLPRSRHERQVQALNACEGCTITGAAPPPRRWMSPFPQPVSTGHRVQRRLLGDRPGEGRHLPGDGHGDHVGMLAFGGESPVSLAEPDLCLPADVLDGLGHALVPLLDGTNILLEDDLLHRRPADHLADPTQVCRPPGSSTFVANILSEQGRLEAELGRLKSCMASSRARVRSTCGTGDVHPDQQRKPGAHADDRRPRRRDREPVGDELAP